MARKRRLSSSNAGEGLSALSRTKGIKGLGSGEKKSVPDSNQTLRKNVGMEEPEQKCVKAVLSDFIKSKLKERLNGNNSGYAYIMEEISSDESPNKVKSRRLIRALTVCLSCVTREHHELISTILSVSWVSQNDKFVLTYINFLENLVSAHAFYIIPCLEMFVKLFTYKCGETEDDPSEEDAEVRRAKQEAAFVRIHQTLAKLVHIIPTAASCLLPVIIQFYPHKRLGVDFQEHYVSNMLTLTSYIPSLKSQIVELIIEKAIKIDVEVKVELVESDDESDDEEDEADEDGDMNSDGGEDGGCDRHSSAADVDVSEKETDEDRLSGDDENSPSVGEKNEEKDSENHEMAEKLDAVMMLLFRYIERTVIKAETDCCISSSEKHDLFGVLLKAFDKTILHTHRSKAVQFLLLFICKLDDKYPELFLGSMLRTFGNSSTSIFVRQTTIAYIAGFIARGKYVKMETVKSSVEVLMEWACRYVDGYDHDEKPTVISVQKHILFYSVCQAVLYIFCFRHREFLSSTAGINYVLKLGFDRLISCNLNPLKVCQEPLVKEFARISRAFEVVYCHSILKRNRKITLRRRTATGRAEGLDTFFPFDPYPLTKSGAFIANIYQEWVPSDLVADNEDVDVSDEYSESTKDSGSSKFLADAEEHCKESDDDDYDYGLSDSESQDGSEDPHDALMSCLSQPLL
eukprot:Nk52_evm57s352 gene=Nk52_evmTU57s352